MSEGEQFHHVDKAWTYKFQSDPALSLCGPVTSTPSSQPLAPNDAFRKSAYWHGLQRLAFGLQRTAATALLPLLTRFTRELQMCTAVVWDIRSPEITEEQNWIHVCRKLMITLLLRHFNTVVSAPPLLQARPRLQKVKLLRAGNRKLRGWFVWSVSPACCVSVH